MLRGVHFDLDGTLVDSYKAITDALNASMRDMDKPEKTMEEVRKMVGGGVRNVLVQAVGEELADAGADRFRVHYRDVILEGTWPLPGALNTLTELHARGYPIGIATNKPVDFARQIVDHLGMRPLVDFVIGPEDVEHPKPAPDMLHLACQRVRLKPEGCVYVGDMPIDAMTARRAGTDVWLVGTGSSSMEEIQAAKPDRILGGLTECLDYLPGLS